MTKRLRQISQLYFAAAALEVGDRAAFLAEAGADDDVRHEVERLLANETSADAFFGPPAIVMAAETLGNRPLTTVEDGLQASSATPAHSETTARHLNLDALQPGGTLGKYEIERHLGRGGMGVVFLARDTVLQRHVAIKVVGTTAHAEPSHHRLLREARSASALNHPNICTVYEVGEAGSLAYIAMEYVDGRPLSTLIDGGALPMENVVRYGIEAADALAHAHDRGVVHRDLKAGNVVVSSSGHLKIVDFGLARRIDAAMVGTATLGSVAGSGIAIGTPYAMAPEQVRGGSVDARTDLWALGVLLHEMISREPPFAGATDSQLFLSILREEPATLPQHTPEPLRQIVHRCLAKDPADRYQRAADVRLLLEAVAAALRDRDTPSVPRIASGSPLPASPLVNVATRAAAFVGREPELAVLEQAWTRAATGERQLLFIAGEPGIGKTRLACEFARGRASSGATVLAGRCDEEALVPYQPFVEALSWYSRLCPEADLRTQLAAVGGGAELGTLLPELRRRIPDLPTPSAMNPEGQRYRLFEGVAALLAQAAALHPVLLVFDDLHWADKPTLLMLRHLVRASSAASLCFVGTYRDSELARTHPLSEMLADFRREPAAARLSLAGLGEAHIKGLIDAFVAPAASSRLAHLVAENTDGNPFFIGEMLRHLSETGALAQLQAAPAGGMSASALSLPEGIKEVIGRRLSRLTDDCNRILSLAAVIGREFDVELLEGLGDLPEDRLLDAIDASVQAQLIFEVPHRAGRFSFAHALIRETLYSELTTARRVRVHRRVGEAIERLSQQRSDPPLADLAYHFVQAASADVADKAIDYATRAGDRAADALALEEAVRLYDMALQSLEIKAQSVEADVRRVDLHTRRARAFGALAQWTAQKADLEEALRHLDPQQIERRAELLVELTAASYWLLDLPSVERLGPQALELAERVHRPDVAANAIAWLAHARSGRGDSTGAIEMATAAIERASGGRTIAYAMLPLYLYLAGRAPDGIACGARATEMARGSRDTTFTMYALAHYALSLGSVGRYSEAAEIFDEVREFGRKYGVRPLLARATAMAAGLQLSLFDFKGGMALASEARELGQSAGFLPSVVSAGIDLLLTFARRHEPGQAESLLPETAAAAADARGSHRWLWESRLTQVRAELALARGAFDSAILEASEGISQSHIIRRPKYHALALVTRAHALHGLGQTADAIVDARRSVAVARSTADPLLLLNALDTLLTLAGDDTSADEARALEMRISSTLPSEMIRQRFSDSEVVQRLRHLSPRPAA